MRRTGQLLISAFLLFGLSAFSALAQPPQSEHFRVAQEVLDAGGGASSSANFRLTSAFGQPTPLGLAASSHFTLAAGFLMPSFSVSPLSPIQDLVIQRVDTTAQVRLDWSAVPGAVSYKIYRDVNPNFTPGPASLLGSTAANTFTDAAAVSLPAMRYYYIITAGTSGIPAAMIIPRIKARTTIQR